MRAISTGPVTEMFPEIDNVPLKCQQNFPCTDDIK